MSASDAVRRRIALVSGAGGAKRHLMHSFNGRFHPIDHGALDVLIDAMVARIDVTAVDYVLAVGDVERAQAVCGPDAVVVQGGAPPIARRW